MFSIPILNVLIPYDFEYVLKDPERIAHLQTIAIQLNLIAPINERDYRFVHLLLRDHLAYTFALLWLQASETDKRLAAAEALGSIGDARAVETLIAALGDPERVVRFRLAEALGKLGDTRAVEPLIEALEDPDEDVRRYAAEMLGKLGDTRAVKPLVKLLEDKIWIDYVQRVCDVAYEALTQIGTPEALQAIIDWLVAGNKYQDANYGYHGLEDGIIVFRNTNPITPKINQEERK